MVQIQKALSRVDGLKQVDMDFYGKTTVQYDDGRTDLNKIKDVIRKEGYTVD